MDKKGKPAKQSQPKSSPPATAGGYPGQAADSGIKAAKAVHDRKPVGRGAARGR